jgi:hypothetical protein
MEHIVIGEGRKPLSEIGTEKPEFRKSISEIGKIVHFTAGKLTLLNACSGNIPFQAQLVQCTTLSRRRFSRATQTRLAGLLSTKLPSQ